MIEYKLNVLMTTYNIENYIEKSIGSVLNQETEYDYNLIIVDDCSSDATVEIINRIIKNHPKGLLINLIINDVNLGVVKNSRKILGLASAPYVAICDGDDYWINVNKIQKQVAFLENNPDFNSTTGIVEILFDSTRKMKIMRDGWNHENRKEEYTTRDYLVGPFSQTSSYLFRNNFTFPYWFDELQSNDATLFLLATGINGKIKYFKEKFSVYRIRNNNYSSKKKKITTYEKTTFFFNRIDEYFEFKFHNTIKIRHLINDCYYYFYKDGNRILIFLGKILIFSLFLFNKYFVKR